MNFVVTYHQIVVKEDIPRLGTMERHRIQRAIEQKLMTTPELFGKPLRRSLKGYRKLRVGDHRIVFYIQGQTVFILAILHRSVVYEEIEHRHKSYLPSKSSRL